MSDTCLLRILAADALACETRLDGPLELGRQRTGEPAPYQTLSASAAGPARWIIAPQHDKDNISRRHLSLTPLPGGLVRIANHSQASLALDDDSLPPAVVIDRPAPFTLVLPGRTIHVLPPSASDQHRIYSLNEPTLGPGAANDLSLSSRSLAGLQPAQLRVLLEGLSRALGVLQSALGTADFLDKASHALVDIVDMDTGRVLLRKETDWQTAAVHGAAPRRLAPSRHVLERLLHDRSTVWQKPQASTESNSPSLRLLDEVVAAPLLDRHNQVIGVLYGERRKDSPRASRSETHVSALLVNLLAGGVATGLARLEQEQAALETRVRFEQFFSPELVRALAADPGMLDGREADVTVLFADVRNFSTYSEKLGAAVTLKWINDVLGELSGCVQQEGGVLVDYIGDELMAMWGAPEAQPDHAARAVRAGLAMQAALPGLDERWQSVLGEPLRIGVGVNSGKAHVGNTGSRLKFKYGPLGNTVNLAARVRGLTKYLRCGVLVAADTHRALGDAYISRRVVRARVVNIEGPVDLYEVEQAGSAERQAFFAESQTALQALEAGDFAPAARAAGTLLASHPGDGPLLLILARAADALVRGGVGFDVVWTPPGK